MIEVSVSRIWGEATDIMCYELVPNAGGELPDFTAGAHIDVHIPGGYIRQYSLCNPPGETHRYQIAALREPESRGGSIALHDEVGEGDRLTISAPRNNFELVGQAEHSILLAGGIGVTPLLCMAEQLARDNASFSFHYCTRSAERMAFMQRISESDFGAQAVFHFDDGSPEQYLQLQAALGEPRSGVHAYVCGPAGFLEFVLSGAREQGWDEDHIHVEYFTAAPNAGAGGDTFQVKIASTGQVFTIPEDRSVVSVLEDAGIEIEMSCEEGVCGTCVTPILEAQGEIDHRDMYLAPKEHRENTYFTPCCSRVEAGGMIVLDL